MNTQQIRTMPLKKVIAYLESVGCKSMQREGRSCIWAITPQYPNQRGLYDIRDLAIELFELSFTQPENQPENQSKENLTMTDVRDYLTRDSVNSKGEIVFTDPSGKVRKTMSVSIPTMTSLHNATAVVEITDSALGKARIVDHGNHAGLVENIADKGEIFTSRELRGYTVGQTVICEIEITGKGSRKVRSHAKHDLSAKVEPEPTVEIADNDTDIVCGDDIQPDTVAQQVDQPISTLDQPIAPIAPIVPVPVHLPDLDFDKWSTDSYHVSYDAKLIFQTAYKSIQRKPTKLVKIMLTGGSGYGKTTLVENFSTFVQVLPCLRHNCAAMIETLDWFGSKEVKSKESSSGQALLDTIWQDSELITWLERGNCVIILDEFNRVPSNLHNALFPILDSSQRTTINGRDIRVGPNVIIVATINQGWQYGGTSPLDEAVFNRFDFVLEVGALPPTRELAVLQKSADITQEDAMTIVQMAQTLREYPEIVCSTRSTLAIANLVELGMSIRDAFEFTIIRRIPGDDSGAPIRKVALDAINAQIGERVTGEIEENNIFGSSNSETEPEADKPLF